MAAAPPTLEVTGLGKRYRLGRMTPRESLARAMGFARTSHPENHHWALRHVSFALNRGDVLGVVGANGAGKSTLLKLMSRVTRPTEGRAVIRGRVGSLLEVGTGFHPELTGMENVFINGAILGMSRKEIRGKLADILDFAGIGKYIDTPVKRYSSGMYTRLAFAIAAHLEPEILIVDEVLAVGDAAFQKRCMQKMKDAAHQGRTILFVSHGAGNVKELCNKAMLLKDGEAVSYGDVDTVLAQYKIPDDPEPAASPEIDLPDGKPDAPGAGHRLHVADASGQPAAGFAIGAPWQVTLDFTTRHRVPGLVAAIGLVTTDGFPVCTCWSPPHDLKPGEHRVRFEIDLPLKACELRLTAGLSNPGGTFYQSQSHGHITIGPHVVAHRPTPPSVTAASGLLTNPHAGVLLTGAPAW